MFVLACFVFFIDVVVGGHVSIVYSAVFFDGKVVEGRVVDSVADFLI